MSRWSRAGRRAAALPDAVSRWARMPRPEAAVRRRFVLVQIDGLSDAVFERALASGAMPRTARLLRRGVLVRHRTPVGLPTSTPAFQAGLMYGGPVDIPGFEFLDKRTGDYLWFPRPWVSARVEAAHAEGRRGIMADGRTYGCIFTGGAADSVLTLAHLLRPSPMWGRIGARARLVPLLLLAWVGLKLSVMLPWEVLRWLGATLRDFSLGRAIASPRRRLVGLMIGGGLRELFTLGVTADIYAGVPALLVNFVDYDVAAHALGPGHGAALRTLRAVDRSIGDIARVVARVPELGYDLFVVSDHGQITSVPFESTSGGVGLADTVLAAFGVARTPESEAGRGRGKRAVATPFRPLAPIWQQQLAYVEPPVRDGRAVWAGGLCVVPAGPNANVYLTHTPHHVPVEEIEARHPGALERLSRHPGIGFILARDARGPVCYYRGSVLRVPPPEGPVGCPLFDRPDRALVTEGLQDLLAMPSAGDVVLFGHYAGPGCISFLGERGSHAGPSESELYGFVLAPPHVEFDFTRVTRPRDLYELFIAYQDANGRAGRTDG